jgi:hypothetical protein
MTRWRNSIDAPRAIAARVSTHKRSSIRAGARKSICIERTAKTIPEFVAKSWCLNPPPRSHSVRFRARKRR